MDQSWDGGGLPPKKKGMSSLAKVGIGLLAAFVLFVGLCFGAGYWMYRTASRSVHHGWDIMRQTAEQLKTEEGARRIYAENPALSRDYPTQEGFLEAAGGWRAKLGSIPSQLPDMETMQDPKNQGTLDLRRHYGGGVKEGIGITYATQGGGRIVIEIADGKLTSLRVD